MYVCATELQQQLQQNKLPTLSPTRSQACGYHHPTNNYPFGRSKQVSRKKSFHIYKKNLHLPVCSRNSNKLQRHLVWGGFVTKK
jgi:hypothetical protein